MTEIRLENHKFGGGELPIVHFESVYRVSTRNSVPAEAEVDVLGRELGMELPLAYGEYVTGFGPGTLSYFLVAKMPSEIRNADSRDKQHERDLLVFAAQSAREVQSEFLAPEEIEEGVIFAYASAEAPVWFASRRQGDTLFEQV